MPQRQKARQSWQQPAPRPACPPASRAAGGGGNEQQCDYPVAPAPGGPLQQAPPQLTSARSTYRAEAQAEGLVAGIGEDGDVCRGGGRMGAHARGAQQPTFTCQQGPARPAALTCMHCQGSSGQAWPRRLHRLRVASHDAAAHQGSETQRGNDAQRHHLRDQIGERSVHCRARQQRQERHLATVGAADQGVRRHDGHGARAGRHATARAAALACAAEASRVAASSDGTVPSTTWARTGTARAAAATPAVVAAVLLMC